VLAGGGAAAAVFAGGGSGAFEGLDVSDGGEGLLGVVLVSGCTDPGGEGFTPPGTAGRSAVGFLSPSGGGVEGDFVSSGITRTHWLGATSYVKNVNFYQLERTVSTSEHTFDKSLAAASLLRDKSNSGTRESHLSDLYRACDW